jgi:hypothetical protein
MSVLGQPWWYIALFALACLMVVGVPIAAWWERRADARDKAAWDLIHDRAKL